MVGSNAHEARAVQRVRAGGVDVQAVGPVGIAELEPELQALGPTDPVLLHHPDFLGPAVKGLQVVRQLAGVVGDAHGPLVQLALFNRGTGPPALAVDNLLIGQDGLVDRVPVDDAFLAVDQASLQQVQEPGLLLAVVAHVAGGELAAPVDAEAKLFQLVAHPCDVFIGPALGIDPAFHGGVFGRQSKGVPAHGVQHREPACAFEPCDHVAQRIVAHMAHVQAP